MGEAVDRRSGWQMIVLGTTDPIGEDNAAAILVDGELLGSVEEERFSRIKHAPFTAPTNAIAWCLEQAGCELSDVDVIAVGFSDPRTILTKNLADVARRTATRRRHSRSLRGEYADYIRHRLSFSRLGAYLARAGRIPHWKRLVRQGRLVFVRHHVAHAASAFFLSPFDEANIISLDGNGGEDAGLLGYGRGTTIHPLEFVDRELSWGIFYERFTAALGFRAHNDEGKVMGLAAYGDHGGEPFPFLRLGTNGFPTYDRDAMEEMLSQIRPRQPGESPINGYHEHIAARLQFTLEQALARISEILYERTGLWDLCLAGGVALNCSANGKLLELPHVSRVFVQPAASDSGTALGAAVHAHTERTGERPRTTFDHAYWGPEFSNEEIEAILVQAKVPYRRSESIAAEAARLIAAGKIVGWFQGRLELGPRALGARSILADPRNVEVKDAVNRNAKFREAWRPFAPSLPVERMEEYFGTPHPSSFMILAFQAREEVKSRIPATLHVDGTGRPQTVTKEANPRYWQLLNEMEKQTGVPVVLNTSFNVDSEPIVCTPRDALRTFYACGMDALAIGDFVLEK
jgi:carbamoyltransferase